MLKLQTLNTGATSARDYIMFRLFYSWPLNDEFSSSDYRHSQITQVQTRQFK